MAICSRCGVASLDGEAHVCTQSTDRWSAEIPVVVGALVGALPGLVLASPVYYLTEPQDSPETAMARAALTIPLGAILGSLVFVWRAKRRRYDD